MARDNVEKNKIEDAIQQVRRDFAFKYGKIQKSELSKEEKAEQINHIFEIAIIKENILRITSSLSELSIQEKEILEIKEENNPTKVDINVVNTLVSIYAKMAKKRTLDVEDETLDKIDTSAFEEELRQYFTEHYYDLLSDGYNRFLSEATEVAYTRIMHKKNGQLTEIAMKHDINPEKIRHFGSKLIIKDGLVAEEKLNLGEINIFYASPEAINKRIYDLYSNALFEEKKRNSKAGLSNNYRVLKNKYITYAEKNGIEIREKDVFEEDINEVSDIATYTNGELNKNGTDNMEKEIEPDVAKQYQREKRKLERKAYMERLIAMRRGSIKELDSELVALQTEEETAKQLCKQYEGQLQDKKGQEL